MRVSPIQIVRAAALLCAGAALLPSSPAAQGPSAGVPTATLIPTEAVTIPTLTDSNSPVIWAMVQGRPRLFLFASESGMTTRLEGEQIAHLESRGLVNFDGHPGHAVWIEAIVPDDEGTLYGYYHNESPAEVCAEPGRTIPRIGAARSRDAGATWEDMGIVLEAPPGSHDCASANDYFIGGVGDFSVLLDQQKQYIYFFFSQYANRESAQGVSAARMVWAHRDAPVGRVSVWLRNQTWLPARMTRDGGPARVSYPAGAPIYRVAESWHGSRSVDAFWGPSVHWNTHLQQYVMLLNRAQDAAWTQEGVYVAFTPHLADPGTWSIPQRVLAGGAWYPQVVGLEPGTGTDREAGEVARFFLGGTSQYFIQFSK